jgi:hypothetical protein
MLAVCGYNKVIIGKTMDLGPELGQVFVIGGMGVGTTDCPQGNDDAGCKRQNAKNGCRICLIASESIGDCSVCSTRRLKQHMEKSRAAAAAAATLSERNDILAAFGLREEESIYSALPVDEWEVPVLPHDPFHLWVMGLRIRLLSLFLSIYFAQLQSFFDFRRARRDKLAS